MDKFSIEEAIKHAKEVADMNYNDAEKFDSNDSVENYMKANHMDVQNGTNDLRNG